MINFNKLATYDFETDDSNPNTCNPVQLACIMVNPRTLEIIPNSEFQSYIRPPVIDDDNYFGDHQETIEWHARVNKCEVKDILETWKDAPPEKDVFGDFQEYLLRYHTRTQRKSKFSAPIKAGQNIIKFDNIIMDRLAKRYGAIDKEGGSTLFHPRDQIDSLNLLFLFFENLPEPTKYNMDVLREFFGMSDKGAHTAIQDVYDSAELIIRFMRLARKIAGKTKFKGAFKNVFAKT